MDTKTAIAYETCQREIAEDTVEAVQERMTVWKRQGRMIFEVQPMLAQREGNIVMVWFTDDSVGIILLDQPDRSTLNGV
jgi:hypothetical protein